MSKTKKGSRLPAALRRCDMIHARVTPSEHDALKEMAANAGISMSDFMVAACFARAGKNPDDLIKLADCRVFWGGLASEKEEEKPKEKKESKDGNMGLL